MIVKPVVPGTVIRDPHTRRALPDEGAHVPDNSFWWRRLHDGDVELCDEPGKPDKKPSPAQAKASPSPKEGPSR